ncbi:MAG: twitching motility protein [Frankiales bacterium]|nr:twitching motility protein [Frankiales bacterium]
MDDYYGAGTNPANGSVSPLDPTWTPAPPLQPVDALEVAQPALAFAPVAEPAPPALAFQPAPPAPPAPAPVVAPTPVAAPAPVATPAPVALSVAPAAVPVQPLYAEPPAPTPPAPAAPPAPVAAAPEPEDAPLPTGNVGIAPEVPAAPSYDAPAEAQAVRVGAEDTSEESGFLTDLLLEVLDRGCSDLHLTVGAPPTVRDNGHLTPMEGRDRLTPQQVQKTLYAILSQKQREKFEETLELDFAYSVPGRARFRVNMYRQRDSVGAAFRLIPYEIKPLEDLGVPATVANFAMLPRGFVLVTGPTGSGKSTTLAAVVDLANRQRRDHIMTVEDPIEFLHEHKSCLVNQREVGEDTHNFKNALKHVLRQDPDIILVGEMRDLETIEIALTAAETGHLVMATLHTQDAAQTIDRVIDVFPPHQQQQVRVQLAGALQGVVCQQLVRTVDGKGRVVATEVLVATPAIRNLIREGKTHQIYSAMQAGAKFGMATMDQHLAELVKKGKVTYDAALEKCHHVEDFQRLSGRA